MSEALDRRWRLRLPDGSERLIPPRGLTIGRGQDADILVEHRSASRAHVVVTVTSDGPQLVPLSPGPTWVDGRRTKARVSLREGALIAVPGLEVSVVLRTGAEQHNVVQWVIERGEGCLFGVGRAGVSVGGSADDDLQVRDLDDTALRFHVVMGRLSISTAVTVEIDGVALPAGVVEPLHAGQTVRCKGELFRVATGSTQAAAGTTEGHDGAGDHPSLPVRACIEFLPRGGRLELRIAGTTHAVGLSEQRCELVACLLQPPRPHVAGEFIDDETLAGRIWPGRPSARTEFNVLVHRLRRDLIAARIDGARLIERAQAGRATRFQLAPGAIVAVR